MTKAVKTIMDSLTKREVEGLETAFNDKRKQDDERKLGKISDDLMKKLRRSR